MNTRSHARRPRLALLLGSLAALASCADLDRTAPGAITQTDTRKEPPPPEPPSVPVAPASSCVDDDQDGFGAGCARGPDCDDANARVTNECRRCLRPNDGCPCAEDEAPVACNLLTGTTEASPEGVCRLGQRTCRNGAWSSCEALANSNARFVGAVSSCYGSCDASCFHIVDCPEASDPAPTSPALGFSTLAPAVFCPSGVNAGGLQPRCENRPGGPYLRAVSSTPWIDACAAPGNTVLLAGVDDGTASVNLPFTFSYWGVPYRTVSVSSNGVLQFSTSSTQWFNTILPSASAPNTVFAFWDDLMLRGGVCSATVGASPNRRAVVQWDDAHFCCTDDPAVHLTFETQLSERDQTIDLVYQRMESPDDRASGSSATVGIQEGFGGRFDLVAFDTPGVISSGTALRWSPQSNDQYCAPGAEHRRMYAASCPAGPVGLIPTWGRMNFTTRVPPGASIRFMLRAAQTQAGLATATPIRLPDAPRASGTTPVPSSYDLGDILQGTMAGLAHMPYLELYATFDTGPDSNLAPVLGSVEVQYNCRPVEQPFRCQAGGDCQTVGPCRRGVVACVTSTAAVCRDAGPIPVGTPCGPAMVCNSASRCVPCNEGATCSTGNVCQYGRISCATGAPVCVPVAYRPAGTVCAFGTGNYTRGNSPLGFVDACSIQGATRYLAAEQDNTVAVTLPFGFRFYGTQHTQVGLSANGAMGFPTVAVAWANTTLPSTVLGDAILPFWDDLQTRPAGICTAVLGRAPERLFVAQWSNTDLQDRGTSGDLGASLNFEVALEESTQAIHVVYGDMIGNTRATGASATVGLQNAARTRFDLVSFDTANSVQPNTAIRWMPPIASACDGAGTCSPCLAAEVCDGRDNTCNGLVDEGMPDITCGVGACRRTVPACLRGVAQTCIPGAPSVDLCDGIDNDCNGIVDDGCGGTLTCPGNRVVHAGNNQVMQVTPRGSLTNYRWEIVSGPPGASGGIVWADPPPRNPTTQAVPIIVGVYRIRVTAQDRNGSLVACDFELTVLPRGLRTELTWDGTGDVDLHMHNNVSGAWFSRPNDCFYSNMTPAWGAGLDVDNITANGPENIRMDTPAAGTYTVAVHNYARAAGRIARVRIYCGGNTTTIPNAEYFSTPLAGTASGNCTGNTFWKVANITVNADGTCSVAPINSYTTSSAACTTR